MAKHLVIDASVGIAAGESENPTSVRCRQVIDAVLDDRQDRYRAVMTKAIEREWKNYEKGKTSRGSSRRLLALYARKKVEWYKDEEIFDVDLREALDQSEAAQIHRARVAMLEDVHLLEAAQAADEIIISLDAVVRKHFVAFASEYEPITQIVWVNPTTDDLTEWLKNGAPPDEQRKLGYIKIDNG